MAQSWTEGDFDPVGKHSANFLRIRSVIYGAICCALLSPAACAQNHPTADTIITHARVYTVNRPQPWAEAIAIKNQHIAAVGSAKQVARWRGAKTEVIDAGGKL